MEDRKHMGKQKEGVVIPVAPSMQEMDTSYIEFIKNIKQEISKQRMSITLAANSSMICLYWKIGKAILEKQEVEGWGTKVIDRMSKDLCDEFPDMKGFSARNIKYMRKFALSWDDYEFVQQVVAQIPWRTNIKLLDKTSDKECRIWYAKQAICNGWSSNILEVQMLL